MFKFIILNFNLKEGRKILKFIALIHWKWAINILWLILSLPLKNQKNKDNKANQLFD